MSTLKMENSLPFNRFIFKIMSLTALLLEVTKIINHEINDVRILEFV
jgi:hypothetical protein